MEGVDYSFTRPDPRQLYVAGKRFAVRYVGTPGSGKNLTPDEADALQAAGLDIVAVYQTTAGFLASGATDGVAIMRRALADARSCGLPDGRPIYFALDINPGSLDGVQWATVERNLNAAASVGGRHLVGVYGGFQAIEVLVPAHAQWGWQTYAWSGGRWSPKAQLQQYRNGIQLANGLVDLCRSVKTDFGQWFGVRSIPQTQPEEIEMKIIDCQGRPALSIGADGVQRITGAQRNALLKIGIKAQLVDQPTSDALWSLHRSFTADVDETMIAAEIVSALGGRTDDVTFEAIEAAVRRVFADAGSEGT